MREAQVVSRPCSAGRGQSREQSMSTSHGAATTLHLATLAGWYRFTRDGDAWMPTGRALTYWSASCLAVDPANPAIVYVGSERSGLFVSRDGGDHWQRP